MKKCIATIMSVWCYLIAFNLVGQPDEDKIIWGTTDHFLQAGILVKERTKEVEIEIFLKNTSKAPVPTVFWLPKINQRYKFELVGSDGKTVPLTTKWEKAGEPLEKSPSTTERREYQKGSIGSEEVGSFVHPFRLKELFQITGGGKYKIRFEQRLFALNHTDGTLHSLALPVTIELNIPQ